jgi:hypothetical protein
VSKDNIYWVKETALYRVPATDPEEAMTKFEARTARTQYLDSIQKRRLYVSTSRWTTKRVEPSE